MYTNRETNIEYVVICVLWSAESQKNLNALLQAKGDSTKYGV